MDDKLIEFKLKYQQLINLTEGLGDEDFLLFCENNQEVINNISKVQEENLEDLIEKLDILSEKVKDYIK